MIANLTQLSPLVWVIAVIVILTMPGLIIWMWRRRFHVTELEVTAGPVKAKLKPEKPTPVSGSVESPSINISRNKLTGKNKIAVRREKTNISDNTLRGENEIEVGARPGPKPQKPKGQSRK